MRSLEAQAAAVKKDSDKLKTDLDDVCAAMRTAETAANQFITKHTEGTGS